MEDKNGLWDSFRRWGFSTSKSLYAVGSLSKLAPSRLLELRSYYHECEQRRYKPDLTQEQYATVRAAFEILSAAISLSNSAVNRNPNVSTAVGIGSYAVDKEFARRPEMQKEFAYHLGHMVNTVTLGPKADGEPRVMGYTMTQLNYCRQKEGASPLEDGTEALAWLKEEVEKNSATWMVWRKERKHGLPFLKGFPRYTILPKPDDIQKEVEKWYGTWTGQD